MSAAGKAIAAATAKATASAANSKPNGGNTVENDVKEEEEDPEAAWAGLSGEQRTVLEAVQDGKSVFFTGSAGTGKSFLLRKIVEMLPAQTTYVTATTGLAAANIGGVTIHSFAGIGLGKDTAQKLLETIRKRSVYRKRWTNAKTLIVDEISMLSADLWDKLEEIAREVRRSQKPFGGLQLVISGDFLQLPPVVPGSKSNSEEPGASPFCFTAKSWGRCVPLRVELQKVFRQSDAAFVSLLNRLRFGEPSSADIAKLRARHIATSAKTGAPKREDGVVPTRLYANKASVNDENQRSLAALPGTETRFSSVDTGKPGSMNSCSAPQKLTLKVGAQVILLKNLDPKRGLVNGSRGVVVGFQRSIKHLGSIVPFVRFTNGVTRLIEPDKWDISAGEKVVGSRRQIPLDLAWALTIHRSQGMTIDCAIIDLAECFEYGQAYVAVSRMKSLEGLILSSFDPRKIKAHPLVVAYYRQPLVLPSTLLVPSAFVVPSDKRPAKRDEKEAVVGGPSAVKTTTASKGKLDSARNAGPSMSVQAGTKATASIAKPQEAKSKPSESKNGSLKRPSSAAGSRVVPGGQMDGGRSLKRPRKADDADMEVVPPTTTTDDANGPDPFGALSARGKSWKVELFLGLGSLTS